MTKTTWTTWTKSQLVAALARKGYGREEVRGAADRAVENGFAWAWGRDAGDKCMALITFSDAEVDMWDASLHTGAEVSCHVCNTMAHAPATLTQVDGIGNACRSCMRDIPGHIEHINRVVAAGKVPAEYAAEMIAALRDLAGHVGVELPAEDDEDPEPVCPFANSAAHVAEGCDDCARDLAAGHDTKTLAFAALAAEDAGPVIEKCAVCVTSMRADKMTQYGREFVCSDCSPADLGIDRAYTVTHRTGITQVFRSPIATRGMGECAIGAYEFVSGLSAAGSAYDKPGEFRTYAPNGSSLGTYAREAEAFWAIRTNDGRTPARA